MQTDVRRKTPMPTLDPMERQRTFSEVAKGYTAALAKAEAQRCLQCKEAPCIAGCPVGVQIPAFIRLIAQGEHEGAYRVIIQNNTLPAVCGRVCPQESQCESRCVRGIKGEAVAIGRLERFAADANASSNTDIPTINEKKGKKMAVVGSGPAGLACAGELCRLGYDVTIFEALHTPGGVLVYGIPAFRLPKEIVRREIDALIAQGVKLETNTIIGRTITVDELLGEEGFSAVFLSTGAGLPKFMGIPGENLKGVCSANEYLTRINLMKAGQAGSDTPVFTGKQVIVVGGGNVAMDAARCARRMGAQVTVVYRRTRAELPARQEEVAHAEEEGIVFAFLTNPIALHSDAQGNVCAVTCLKMALGEPDSSGRRRPVTVSGSEHDLAADCVIMALGTSPNPLIRNTTPGLATASWGGIIVNEGGCETSREGVFAGGDAVTGAATVILAMGAGRNAAKAMDAYAQGR